MTDPLIARAIQAARAWGGALDPPVLIKNRENAVFKVRVPAGTAALRLHRPGYQTTSAIEAELIWTAALANHGFPCPRPLPTTDGAWTKCLPDGQCATMIAWLDAVPIGDAGKVPTAALNDQIQLHHDLGQLLARFHQTVDACDLRPLDRPGWLSTDLVGPDPRWGRFWDNPALTPDEAALLRQAADQAATQLADRPESEIGLIHADALQENILRDRQGLWLIDFDDGGWGYRPYDLGTALIQHIDTPAYPDLTAALVDGYGRPDWAADIPFFVMLRGMASAGWIISRAARGDRRHRVYADRALMLVRAWRM
ncbi:phosphotransferase enzyme family protein [Actibacterium sp. 188UL27-1]|uniref:phosphotransferase enzyme family protein n=1 Tax=Actibacterium sp. 188UL27-1 TaxID=2786961 RepID=UPI00195C5370|nr:phosphotransferase [Actibacterium sp. 188UL27-1]MBM7067123.1 phosphotransferase [Actibacterium sp. 188UL27-1]